MIEAMNDLASDVVGDREAAWMFATHPSGVPMAWIARCGTVGVRESSGPVRPDSQILNDGVEKFDGLAELSARWPFTPTLNLSTR
ncbi:hypothetical protein DMB66_19480 [Actinoplanes sp. ATCC 53533]|uniref:hypothetical protein n=1 Tax=Actinoplanes sp. ATCC 53533 TaxID=1288362 RepID=UPI000F78702F|nr:hypothetical protein [Actinoplanes sp. ATCC 53533]RSM64512.1 hypothetical protein DMB66_19480 [Actinoplanes sp. ATCC 53533]